MLRKDGTVFFPFREISYFFPSSGYDSIISIT